MQNYVGTLPKRVLERVNQVYENQKFFYISLKEKFEKVIKGTEKKEICDWWLVYIEHNTNQYLKGKGFRENLLPEDYLNTPPDDLDAVEQNSRYIFSSFFVQLFRQIIFIKELFEVS